jgi:hypothetical protein
MSRRLPNPPQTVTLSLLDSTITIKNGLLVSSPPLSFASLRPFLPKCMSCIEASQSAYGRWNAIVFASVCYGLVFYLRHRISIPVGHFRAAFWPFLDSFPSALRILRIHRSPSVHCTAWCLLCLCTLGKRPLAIDTFRASFQIRNQNGLYFRYP